MGGDGADAAARRLMRFWAGFPGSRQQRPPARYHKDVGELKGLRSRVIKVTGGWES